MSPSSIFTFILLVYGYDFDIRTSDQQVRQWWNLKITPSCSRYTCHILIVSNIAYNVGANVWGALCGAGLKRLWIKRITSPRTESIFTSTSVLNRILHTIHNRIFEWSFDYSKRLLRFIWLLKYFDYTQHSYIHSVGLMNVIGCKSAQKTQEADVRMERRNGTRERKKSFHILSIILYIHPNAYPA